METSKAKERNRAENAAYLHKRPVKLVKLEYKMYIQGMVMHHCWGHSSTNVGFHDTVFVS